MYLSQHCLIFFIPWCGQKVSNCEIFSDYFTLRYIYVLSHLTNIAYYLLRSVVFIWCPTHTLTTILQYSRFHCSGWYTRVFIQVSKCTNTSLIRESNTDIGMISCGHERARIEFWLNFEEKLAQTGSNLYRKWCPLQPGLIILGHHHHI